MVDSYETFVSVAHLAGRRGGARPEGLRIESLTLLTVG